MTKPKDVKFKRINKAKSRSLEELRGRLKCPPTRSSSTNDEDIEDLEEELIEEVFGSLQPGAVDGNIALDDILEPGFFSILEITNEPSLSTNCEFSGSLLLGLLRRDTK